MSAAVEQETAQLPAWFRYANDEGALFGIVYELRQEIVRNPILAGWCREQIAEIQAHMRRVFGYTF